MIFFFFIGYALHIFFFCPGRALPRERERERERTPLFDVSVISMSRASFFFFFFLFLWLRPFRLDASFVRQIIRLFVRPSNLTISHLGVKSSSLLYVVVMSYRFLSKCSPFLYIHHICLLLDFPIQLGTKRRLPGGYSIN